MPKVAAAFRGWHRSADVKSLRRVTAKLAQAGLDPLGLHALGGDLEPEVAGQLDYRPDQGGVAAVRVHPCHERAVNLDLVNRQLLQLRQGRESGAKVVDRNLHAHSANLVERASRASEIRDDAALGDFELKRRCWQVEPR